MNESAFFLLMLAGMLGYLALIGRVLRRRRGGAVIYQPAPIEKTRPGHGARG